MNIDDLIKKRKEIANSFAKAEEISLTYPISKTALRKDIDDITSLIFSMIDYLKEKDNEKDSCGTYK